MVTQEVREAEEEKRVAKAVGQSQQGSWTSRESVEQHTFIVERSLADGTPTHLISM